MGMIAVISDIHGNADGLKVTLEDVQNQGVQRIICLGDLVDGASKDSEVIKIIRSANIESVQGNHDECNDLELCRDEKEFLRGLNDIITQDNLLFTHISPRRYGKKINTPVEAWNVFEESEYHRIFVGHIHYPLLYSKINDSIGESKINPVKYNIPISLEKKDRYIICPGSIGYSRDFLQKIRYVIYHTDEDLIEFRAIDGPLM